MKTALLRFVRNLKSRDPLKLNRRLFTFLVCVLISSLFWVLNALSKRYTTFLNYPVVYVNPPQDNVLVSDLPSFISLRLEAIGYHLFYQQLTSDEDTLRINISELKALGRGNSEGVIITASKMMEITRQFGSEIKVLSVEPDTIYFKLARKKSKTVPVKLNIFLSFRKQHQLKDKITVIPETVVVSGPDYLVDSITSVETDSVILQDLHEQVTKNVRLRVPQAKGIKLSTSYAVLTVPVEKFTEGSVVVSVQPYNLPAGASLKLIPAQVEIFYLVPFSKFNLVKENMFEARVNYNKAAGKQNLPVELSAKPDYVNIIKIAPEKVEYIIKKEADDQSRDNRRDRERKKPRR